MRLEEEPRALIGLGFTALQHNIGYIAPVSVRLYSASECVLNVRVSAFAV